MNDVFRDLGGGVILQTRANVGKFQSAGLELVANGRLPGKVSYNVSGNLLWSEIDATGLGFGAGRREAYTAAGRASLSWQATDKDLVQLQGFVNGKVLLTQGYRKPLGRAELRIPAQVQRPALGGDDRPGPAWDHPFRLGR